MYCFWSTNQNFELIFKIRLSFVLFWVCDKRCEDLFFIRTKPVYARPYDVVWLCHMFKHLQPDVLSVKDRIRIWFIKNYETTSHVLPNDWTLTFRKLGIWNSTFGKLWVLNNFTFDNPFACGWTFFFLFFKILLNRVFNFLSRNKLKLLEDKTNLEVYVDIKMLPISIKILVD